MGDDLFAVILGEDKKGGLGILHFVDVQDAFGGEQHDIVGGDVVIDSVDGDACGAGKTECDHIILHTDRVGWLWYLVDVAIVHHHHIFVQER